MVKNAKRICVAICFGSSNNLTGLLRDRCYQKHLHFVSFNLHIQRTGTNLSDSFRTVSNICASKRIKESAWRRIQSQETNGIHIKANNYALGN